MTISGRRWRGGILVLALALACARAVRADIDIVDSWDNGSSNAGQATNGMLFPNWRSIYAGSYDIWLCDSCGSAVEQIKALTVVNFGSAGPGDITNVLFKIRCSSQAGVLTPMTYAGNYLEDSGTYPAWTWAGTSVDLNGCADLCAPGPTCGGYFSIDIYCDITPCPADQATVSLGFPIHMAYDPFNWGSIYDNYGYVVPWYDMQAAMSTIVYAYKTGQDTVVPGDTVTYTIYYGKPGTAALTTIDVMDTQPPYTHYVFGSAVPAPLVGWDPNFGPPLALKWTVNPVTGNIPAWGPTNELRFSLSVDWGNGESFEPGSGDVAAPEGIRLSNAAQVFFNGTTCSPNSAVTPPVSTVAKRFMFWCLGDNDVLFSPSWGQPPDEMTYSIFIKNLSDTYTWWDVHLWDTVPADLDPWSPNLGFDDPCSGWTMTPSGCAAASPGRIMGGGKTLLTWRLDMPPQMTLELRWKAQVSPTAQAQGTVINTLSVLEYGRTNIVGGTGHSGPVRKFSHLAPIVLPTMYTSYVGYAANSSCCPGYLLDFFPLNKKTQFELRGILNVANPFALTGGPSASIGTLLGDCLGGFPMGGISGCKVERVPAKFDPGMAAVGDCTGICPVFPFNYIFKVTSNAPTLWQCLTHIISHDEDNHTYAPATTLSYTGLMHYMWRRDGVPNDPPDPGNGDSLALINTSMDPYGVYDSLLDTTVYIFKFNYGTLGWDMVRSYDIAPESQAFDWNTTHPIEGAYRTVSSQGQLIVNQGMLTIQSIAGGASDNFAAFMPIRETGNTVSKPGQTANFYGIVHGASIGYKVIIGNLGLVDAVYRIWRYTPDSLIVPAKFPPWLGGTSGTWVLKATQTVPAGLATANNPRTYATDGTYFDQSNTIELSKIELLSGGPIQVLHGMRTLELWAGGSVMHPADGNQTGIEYWLHHADGGGKGCANETWFIDVFCPKQGMAVNMISEDGFSATYTTTGPDQCIAFVALSQPATTRNYKISVMPNPAQGNVVCQYIQCTASEKGWTAPFLQQGVHYEIIAPAMVFSGQTFWITIVVKDVGGTTKTDYTGTSSFTSTDPNAKILGTPMETTNYTWTGCPGTCGVHIFMLVTLTKLGMQTIVAQDTVDGSINGLTAILVVATDIKLSKTPRLTIGASGDTVSFRVCWSNYSSASAFTFVITDAVPTGTTFLPEAGTAAFDCGNTRGVAPIAAYSTATSTTPPAAFTEANPAAGSRWLRWTIPSAGVNTTGCICYRVTVN